MKRALDVAFAAAGLILLAPVLFVVAVAVRLAGGAGPVLFRQERMGRNFRLFRIVKFRTMVAGADARGPGVTVHNDGRVTRLGSFLRRTKLDELPQLLNVLRGEMSLVGPRPELGRFVRRYQDDYREILRLRPGITDLASITYRNESALLASAGDPEAHYLEVILPDKIRLARKYVEQASVFYDLRLLLETLIVLIYPAAAIEGLLQRLGRRHVTITGLIQAILAAAAFGAAMVLAFGGAPPNDLRDLVLAVLPIVVLVRLVWLRVFRLYRDVWQYVGMKECVQVVLAVGLGSGTLALLWLWPPVSALIPISVLVIDGLLATLALVGIRVLRRVLRELRTVVMSGRRVLVVGVNDSAERVLRGLASRPGHDFEVVGLLAENGTSRGLRIHDVPIVGGYDQLESVLRQRHPDEVFIVASAVPDPRRQELVRVCRGAACPVRVVPDLDDLLDGKGRTRGIEPPDAESLLFREPVHVDGERIRSEFRGHSVLVTGAGGTIGSEICRQIAACEPSRLVLFEKHEASLYHIERELRGRYPELALVAAIGDVHDAARVREVIEASAPETIFHAAAYKHVPMMEHNPWEALKNNVVGTHIVAAAAHRAGVRTFILVSTDKAVEPVCVMGASKRLAELSLLRTAAESQTRFLTVRFGNVLESSGSVIPLFREQIERGGPVTVTHPEVTRWFMTVPEAVQLILTTATLGSGSEVFVLDMGKPVRVLDLARALIEQYGLHPGKDIDITFTGLRPGERLFEKLFNDHEVVWKTAHPRILMAVAGNHEAHANGNGNGLGHAYSNGNGNGNGHPPREIEELRRLMQLVERAAGTPRDAARDEVARQLEDICV